MIYWEKETTCDNRPFSVLDVEVENGDTLEEFCEFVTKWIYKAEPKGYYYFRVDWHTGDRSNANCVVIDGARQLDCFLSGLDASKAFAKKAE